ncbi:MAG: DUF4876 domain-containing protein [Bacteroidales bacterium]
MAMLQKFYEIRIGVVLLAFVTVLFSGCKSDVFDRDAILFNVSVQVLYPEYYNADMAEGVSVRLINIDNHLVSTKTTDAQGCVTFESVPRGKYRISSGMKIPSATAMALGDTIVSDADVANGRKVNLNATMENLSLNIESNLGTVRLKSSLPGDLLIKEVFYTGTRTPNNKAYYSDHFLEIYNNTDKVMFVDSICVATVYGANGSVDYSSPTLFASDKDNVYLDYIWMIPGSGKTQILQPGKSVLIAQDGLNHKEDANGNPNSIDLSFADFETFLVRDDQRDIDILEVPNMTEIFASRPNTHDWIFHSYGPGIVVFKVADLDALEVVPEPNSTSGYQLVKLPVSAVLDAFEALANSVSGKFKRIPASLDMGFIYCNGIYNGESCRRKVEDTVDGRVILQDTNNSSDDFEVLSSPTPKSFE